MRDLLERKREPWEHPSNSKSPGERKNVSVCGRSSLVLATCLQMLSNHMSTHYIHTRLPDIIRGKASERETHSGRRTERVRKNKSIGREGQCQRERAGLKLRTETAACSVTSNQPSQGCGTNRRCSSCVTLLVCLGKDVQELFDVEMII